MKNLKRAAVAVGIVLVSGIGLAGTASADGYGNSTAGNAAPLGPAGAYLGTEAITLARILNSLL